MRLSVLTPAHNEEGSLAETVRSISATLLGEAIEHEIVVVNDHSSDDTAAVLDTLKADVPGYEHCTIPVLVVLVMRSASDLSVSKGIVWP